MYVRSIQDAVVVTQDSKSGRLMVCHIRSVVKATSRRKGAVVHFRKVQKRRMGADLAKSRISRRAAVPVDSKSAR